MRTCSLIRQLDNELLEAGSPVCDVVRMPAETTAWGGRTVWLSPPPKSKVPMGRSPGWLTPRSSDLSLGVRRNHGADLLDFTPEFGSRNSPLRTALGPAVVIVITTFPLTFQSR